MGKQINQYTKTRIKTSTQSDDLMDLDSTEDSGVTFESAKMKVSEFIGYILEQIPPLSLYVIDGTISANRTVTALGRFTKWVGGNVTIKMADAINNYGFTIEDNLGAEKAEMGYDQSTGSGFLKIDNNDLYVNDGFVGLRANAPLIGESIRLAGNTSVNGLLTVGNAPFVGASIQIPDNQGLAIGNTFRIGATSGVTYIDAGNNNQILFRAGGNQVYMKTDLNNLELTSTASAAAVPTTSYNVALNSSYWNGSSSRIKGSFITHNITAAPSGISQLDFKIDGSTLVTMMDNGRVGIGTSAPHASAKLEVSSTTQGFLKPVMTTTQRDAIASPASGLEVFNTTTGKMNFYDGDAWKVITSS